jgi:hypothetical protein
VKATITTKELNTLWRDCKDIGMFATDRPIFDTKDYEGSCLHKTPFCEVNCYNNKLYKIYPKMHDRDNECERIWQSLPSDVEFYKEYFIPFFAKKKLQTKRRRFMTRGEAIKDMADIYRIRAMALAEEDVTWWLPTKAWRNKQLKMLIELELMPLKNIALNASTDPDTTDEEYEMLKEDGWNTMFFGDDEGYGDYKMFHCPKTYKGIKGHCKDCKAGCFSNTTINRRSDVHLIEH